MPVLSSKVLPHDSKARRLFVTSGGLKKVQEIEAEPGSPLQEYINAINGCFPEEIVRYCVPPSRHARACWNILFDFRTLLSTADHLTIYHVFRKNVTKWKAWKWTKMEVILWRFFSGIYSMCHLCFRYYSPGYSEALLERLDDYQPAWHWLTAHIRCPYSCEDILCLYKCFSFPFVFPQKFSCQLLN